MPRKARKEDSAFYAVNGLVCPSGLGWEDIQNMEEGTVAKTFMDDTLPGGPTQRTITYVAPFFKKDREADYAEAWAYFEKAHGLGVDYK